MSCFVVPLSLVSMVNPTQLGMSAGIFAQKLRTYSSSLLISPTWKATDLTVSGIFAFEDQPIIAIIQRIGISCDFAEIDQVVCPLGHAGGRCRFLRQLPAAETWPKRPR